MSRRKMNRMAKNALCFTGRRMVIGAGKSSVIPILERDKFYHLEVTAFIQLNHDSCDELWPFNVSTETTKAVNKQTG